MNKKLNEMQIGEKAVISGYEKSGSSYRQKLLSMGLTKGTEILLTKLAPLGDPIEIEVRGFKLSLRKIEADVLMLEGGSNE